MVFVDELGAACARPAPSVNAKDRVIVRPPRVTSGQVTRPLVVESVQLDKKSLKPNGPRSHPRPSGTPPKNSGRMPPPIMPPPSRALRSGRHASPASPRGEKLLSVALKPAGVERNAAARSGDALVGDVESEHAVATTIARATRILPIDQVIMSFSERL